MLQSVIRNLVDSNDEEERLAQRSKLESDLEVANERLDNLVQGIRSRCTLLMHTHTHLYVSLLYTCIYTSSHTYVYIISCALFSGPKIS